MKTLTILLTLCFTSPALGLDPPAEVPSKITELRSKSWYQELSSSWKSYLEANSDNQLGWIQYYRAAVFSGEDANALTAIATEAKTLHPESFTSNYLSFKEAGWSSKGIRELKAAF